MSRTQPSPELVLEPDGLTPYLRRLFLLVSVATLFEGFDTLLTSLALPYLAKEFEADSEAMGRAVGLIGVGTVLAFAPVRLADRFGRRPMLLTAVVGYTAFSVASAFSQRLSHFITLQLLARMFMVTEIGLAFVILSEEMPARMRGRANASLMAFAGIGGILAALAFQHVIDSPLGWRGLYLLSGLLLPLLPIYWWQIRETRRWNERMTKAPPTSVLHELRRTRIVFHHEYRRSTYVGTILWLTVNLWTGSAVFWFNYYAVNERGWSPDLIATVLPVASVIGFVGYFATGPLMDFVGRRFTASLYLGLGGLATIMCFTSHTTWVIAACYIVFMALQAVWSVAGTITSELFPTSVRATGNAVTNNLLGRFGMVVAGFAVGTISSHWLGSVGNAVAFLSILNFLCLPVLMFLLPETRGRALEEIASSPYD